MSKREKILIGIIVCAILAIIGLICGLVSSVQENKKYEAVINIACEYSGDAKNCHAGMEMIRGMSVDEINNFSPSKYLED